MIFPNQTTFKQDGKRFSATMFIEEDLPYLQGHFEKKAVLPGVVHTGWALSLVEKFTGHNFTCHELHSIKCTQLVLPPIELEMTAQYDEDKGLIKFKSQLSSGKCASGTILVEFGGALAE